MPGATAHGTLPDGRRPRRCSPALKRQATLHGPSAEQPPRTSTAATCPCVRCREKRMVSCACIFVSPRRWARSRWQPTCRRQIRPSRASTRPSSRPVSPSGQAWHQSSCRRRTTCALTRMLGCTATATESASLSMGHDELFNYGLLSCDWSEPDQVADRLRHVLPDAVGSVTRDAAIREILGQFAAIGEAASLHCVQAMMLTARLPLPAAVSELLGHIWARWDGRFPGHAAGAGIPLPARIITLARGAELARRAGGQSSARGSSCRSGVARSSIPNCVTCSSRVLLSSWRASTAQRRGLGLRRTRCPACSPPVPTVSSLSWRRSPTSPTRSRAGSSGTRDGWHSSRPLPRASIGLDQERQYVIDRPWGCCTMSGARPCPRESGTSPESCRRTNGTSPSRTATTLIPCSRCRRRWRSSPARRLRRTRECADGSGYYRAHHAIDPPRRAARHRRRVRRPRQPPPVAPGVFARRRDRRDPTNVCPTVHSTPSAGGAAVSSVARGGRTVEINLSPRRAHAP